MKNVSAALKEHLEQEVTTLAVLWKVVRQDGAVFSFTDHTDDLTYDGDVYKASTGFFRSALSNTATPEGADMEVSGMLDDDGIVERDLLAGKFDYAEVWLRLVNYEDLTMGHLPLRFGRFGEVQTMPSGKFVIELKGLIAQLSNAIGDTYSPDCRTDLFSPKCGLLASAAPRIAGKLYALGDRVTVPTLEVPGAYAIPFVNLDFQDLLYAASDIWTVQGMIARVPEGVDYRVMSPTAWVSSFKQTVDITVQTVNGTMQSEFTATVRSLSYGPDLQLRLRLVFLDETFDEISTVTSLYKTLSGLETHSLAVAAPLGACYAVWWTETRAKPGTVEMFDLNSSTRFDTCVFRLSAEDGNLLVDPSFLTFALASASVAGWSSASYLAPYQTRFGMPGPNGKMFVMNTATVLRTYTSGPVSLEGGPFDDDDIDTGDYVIDLSWWQANFDLNGEADIIVVFFGPSLAPTGVASGLDYQEVVPVGNWKNRKKMIPVPVGARTMSIQMKMRASRSDIDGAVMSALSDLSVSMRSVFDLGYNFASYGGVEYIAGNAGTAGSSPAFGWNRTLGATVVDGDITWTAVVPRWSNLATVDSVTSRGIFTLDDAVDRADDFFQWGTLVFLTGPNAGFSCDVVQWVSASNRIVLALPLPFVPEIGDQVWVEVGCDKTIDTCAAKFMNAINFRGEPRLPGTDQYFKVGSPA